MRPFTGARRPAPLLLPLAVSAALLPASRCVPQEGGESPMGTVLYNGIRLPQPWPPTDRQLSFEPPPLPDYLATPPAVIPIDVGRQLFVDDFLIEETTLQRTYHAARYFDGNPVLRPDQPWEQEGGPTAMVFSDGVWHDPADGLYKMWYMGGYGRATCYAFSRDGVHWEKPQLDVVPGTNIVQTTPRDSATVWLDLATQDPSQRYKLCTYTYPEGAGALTIWVSPDGIHWGAVGTARREREAGSGGDAAPVDTAWRGHAAWGEPVARSGPCGDRTTVFYNPFRQVWVYSLRGGVDGLGRIRQYWEHRDLVAGASWEAGQPPLWVGADRLDPMRADLQTPCQLYNLDCVAYESVLLGLFSIWRGQPQDRPKPNEVVVGFSRDGFHWYRPSREPFIPVSERQGDWNWGNVQSAGGCCLVVGDELWFYVSGRAGEPGTPKSGVSSTGLAILRRDGFASLDAGEQRGTITTRPVRFTGRYLFVNADADEGELRVEVLNEAGEAAEPFARRRCVPVRSDGTLLPVTWKGAEDLSALAGQPVRLRFHLRRGSLYSFWVSPDRSGASHGYVAAGGPGFTGMTDDVGVAALGTASTSADR